MNFDEARKKHADWRFKFKTAMSKEEILDVELISKDNFCDLGKWLYGEGKQKYGKIPSYADCVKHHAHFHLEASRVALLINAKKLDEARMSLGIGSGFSSASGAIGNALDALQRDASLGSNG